jgi:hypothetical protein
MSIKTSNPTCRPMISLMIPNNDHPWSMEELGSVAFLIDSQSHHDGWARGNAASKASGRPIMRRPSSRSGRTTCANAAARQTAPDMGVQNRCRAILIWPGHDTATLYEFSSRLTLPVHGPHGRRWRCPCVVVCLRLVAGVGSARDKQGPTKLAPIVNLQWSVSPFCRKKGSIVLQRRRSIYFTPAN